MMYLLNSALIFIITSALDSQVSGLHCRNVALQRVVRTPTGEMTYKLTNGRHKFKCLPSINMNYPEIVVNFAEKTPVSFLHIFVSPSVPAAYTFNLRVGLRSWYGSASGILSPLLTICDEYHGRAVKSIITIHCLHFIENVFLVVQGIGHTRLPICEIQAYSYSECENLALGKVATMSEDQDHNYAMLAVDGNKYEPDMCVTLTSRSNKLMWWSVNLGHEYVVGFVNIYYYTTKCVVTRFEPTSKRLRKPKNHFASFYVELNMCKWLCESYKNCTGIDFNNDKDSTSATECYIHTRGISSIDREQRGHRSYTFLGVTRNCKTPRRDKPSISNWASLSGQPNIYKRVVAFRVTISISVQTKRSTSVSTRNACVHNRIYTFTGAVSIKCDQTVLGRHVSISSRQKLPVIFSEVEIFVDEFPQNIALGKVADSSATIGMGTPYDAIDGSIILEDIKEHIPIPGASYPTKKVKEYWWLVVLDKNKVHIGYIFIYLKKKDQVNIRSFIVGFKQSTTYKATDGICGYVGSKKSTVAIHKCDEYTKAPIVFVGKGDGSYVDLVEVEVFEYKSVMCHEEESGNGYVRKHLPVIISRTNCPTTCDDHVVAKNVSLVLNATCKACIDVKYTWWSNTSASVIGQNTSVLVFSSTSFVGSVNYMFTVEVKSVMCTRLRSTATFSVYTSWPIEGHCYIEPDVGRAYITLFSVNCTEFKNKLEAGPDNYRYFVKNALNPEGITLYEGPNPNMPPKILQSGSHEDNYKRIVYIDIKGSIGWSVIVNVSVVVKPTDMLTSNVVAGIGRNLYDSTGQTLLNRYLSIKNFQGALDVISSAADGMNHAVRLMNYTTGAIDKMHKLQKLMVSTMSRINASDVDDVLSKVHCLNIISDSDHMELETQAAASDVYIDLARNLKNVAYRNATTTSAATSHVKADMYQIEKISTTVIRGVTTLMNRPAVTSLSDTEIDHIGDDFDSKWTNDKEIRKYHKRNIVRKAMAASGDVATAVLLSMNPGQEPFTMQVGTINQVLKKDTAARLSQRLVTVPSSYDGSAVSLKIPVLGSSQTDVFGLQVLKLSRNPYMWHSSAKQVNSDVVGISIYREDGETVRLKNLIQPFSISLPRKRETIGGIVHLSVKMNQHGDTFSLSDLERFTAEVDCNKNYQIILSPHTSNTYTSIFLIVKTDLKVFVRDFFRDSRKERNITLLTVNFHNQTTRTFTVDINKANNAGLEYVVEGRGIVSLFGRMSDRRPRCQLYIGMLPTFYDSTRCKLCESESKKCGFCTWEAVVNTEYEIEVKSTETRNDKFLDISATTYTNDCLYWDEDTEIWTNDGCKVSLNSSADIIVCNCRHLSVFSADNLIQPNKLDPFKMSFFLSVFYNPIVFALVIAVWCIYALLMVWARRKDSEDLMKQGVIVISTAVDAEYYYLITVITGWQRNAGTSATVAMYMIGSLGVSETLVLTDPTRFVHVSGAESWFLVAITETLGQLLFLRIWHNCSGIFPSWFLKQITIRDIQTNQVWTFVCDDWLTPELSMSGIKKSLYANEDKRSRLYDFRLTSMQTLRSEHPWISIFSRPVYKTFNRAQRLSVVMSFAMFNMLTNIMFYGKPPAAIEEGALGGIAITKEQLIVAIESFLICLPTCMLIAAIFTNTRPHEKRDLCIEFDVVAKKEYDDGLLITLRKMNQRIIASLNVHERDESSASLSRSRAVSVISSSNTSTGRSSSQMEEIHETAEKAKGCLPWWFIYIGWTVTLGSGFAASFVTILYGLTYGYGRSVAWLVSFFSTFFQDTGIFEPIKITAAAAFATFIAGARARPNVPDSYTLNRGVDEALSSVDSKAGSSGTFGSSSNTGSSSTSPNTKMLPTRSAIRAGKSTIKKEHRMRKVCNDLFLSVITCVFLMAALNSGALKSAYLFQKSMVDTFVRVRYGSNVTFTEVRTTDEMWHYIKYSFVPSLLLGKNNYVADETNVLVGLARIRQLRVIADACSNSYGPYHSLGDSCFTPYSLGAEDKSSYSPSWHNVIRNNSNVANQSPWTYHSADETDTSVVWSRYHVYSGGGYVIPVWTTRMLRMRDSLEKLQNASWVDEKTRAVFLEFTVFNPRTDLFASTVLLFEFTDIGTIDSRYNEVAIHKVYAAANIDDIYCVVFESIYLTLITVYIFKAVRQFWRMRHGLLQYFFTIWPVADCVIILLTVALVPVIPWRQVVTRRISTEIRDSGEKKFISFSQIVIFQFLHTALLNVVHFLLMMNILRLSIFFGKRNMVFAFNVFRATTYVFYMAFLFLVVFIMTVLTSQSLFGSYCGGYMFFTKTIINVANLFRYSAVCSENECIQDSPFVNLLFFGFATFFVVLMWRLLVLMCGISAQYAVVARHERADLRFVDYVTCRLLIGSGNWTMDDYIAHEKLDQIKRRRQHLMKLRSMYTSYISTTCVDSDTNNEESCKDTFSDTHNFNGLPNAGFYRI